jgi:Right handed beta helix region
MRAITKNEAKNHNQRETMKKILFLLPFLLAISTQVNAKDWHVSGTGNDANDGSSPTKAFRTLKKAESVVQPGDVVLIGNGTYTDSDTSDGSAVLPIKKSGRPDAWITWKAAPGQQPVIHAIGWNSIYITGSYHIIDGLTVKGNNDRIVLLRAQEDEKKKTPDPYFNTNGILVDGRIVGPDVKPHHIIIRNCTVYNVAGGGITAIEADYITIEDNKVYNNAWFMRYGGSGISFLDNWAYDDAPGYHNIVQRNYVWNNKTMVSWSVVGKLSDGNGIIMDVTEGDEVGATNPDGNVIVAPVEVKGDKPKRPQWKGRSLVANNVSAYNGGSGIHAFRAAHVDIINNTTYGNGSNVGYAEIFAAWSRDVNIINNVIVPRPDGRVTSNNKNRDVRWDYNIYPIEQSVLKGKNDIVADINFIKIDADLRKSDFRLAKGSKAIDSGSNELPQAGDIERKPRPKGKGRDRGAFEQ